MIIPSTEQKSTGQVFSIPAGGILVPNPPIPRWIPDWKLREASCDPLIRACIDYLVGDILRTSFDVVWCGPDDFEHGNQDSIVDFVSAEFEKWRSTLIRVGIRNAIIYGWQAFERVYSYDADEDKFRVTLLQPLIHQGATKILATMDGEYFGCRQYLHGKCVDILAHDSILVNIDVYGNDHYGTSMLLGIVPILESIKQIRTQLGHYFNLAAGLRIALHYPAGRGMVNGKEVVNYDVAKDVVEAVTSGNSVTIPILKGEHISDTERDWYFETLPNMASGAGDLLSREKDLIAQITTALGVPYRVLFDGESGSYSNAEMFKHTASVVTQSKIESFVDAINKSFINDVTRINFNAQNIVKVVIGNVGDETKSRLSNMLPTLTSIPYVDMKSVLKEIGVPFSEELESEPNEPNEPSDGFSGLFNFDDGRVGFRFERPGILRLAVDTRHVDSSAIQEVSYDDVKNVLEVVFSSGNVYQYDVPNEGVFYDLLEAASQGQFFVYNIRNDYPYRRVNTRVQPKQSIPTPARSLDWIVNYDFSDAKNDSRYRGLVLARSNNIKSYSSLPKEKLDSDILSGRISLRGAFNRMANASEENIDRFAVDYVVAEERLEQLEEAKKVQDSRRDGFFGRLFRFFR